MGGTREQKRMGVCNEKFCLIVGSLRNKVN
jgi:hypothetical protein